MAADRPLTVLTYLSRNVSKTAPVVTIIALAVMLTAGVVALIHSIPASIRTIYGYAKQELAVIPRMQFDVPPEVIQQIKTGSPVPIERLVIGRASLAEVRSIVGSWPFFTIGLERSDLEFFLKRQGTHGIIGRLPAPGEPEAIISEPVSRNLNLPIGGVLLRPDKRERFSPMEVKVVGIAKSDHWFMITSIEYQRAHQFPPIESVLVFARTESDQKRLDTWALDHVSDPRVDVIGFEVLEKITEDMFSILFRILNMVIVGVVGVITFVIGLLINIYHSQRLVEFGLLQAIGHSRRRIFKRVLGEAATLVLAGWAIGVAAAFGVLHLVNVTLMTPNAFILDEYDLSAYGYTVLMPIAVIAAASLLVYRRFRRFDPVLIVERRLV